MGFFSFGVRCRGASKNKKQYEEGSFHSLANVEDWRAVRRCLARSMKMITILSPSVEQSRFAAGSGLSA